MATFASVGSALQVQTSSPRASNGEIYHHSSFLPTITRDKSMEFLDEETRPRLFFQSRAAASQIPHPECRETNKLLILICFFLSSLLIALSIFFLQSEILKFFLFWSALSLLLGPLAPLSVTGGDIRVGRGEVLEFLDQDPSEEIGEVKKRVFNRRQQKEKLRRSDEVGLNSSTMQEVSSVVALPCKLETKGGDPAFDGTGANGFAEEEREWNDEDVEMLRKQLMKHPVGKPRRWEMIADAFQGRHSMNSVIKKAKDLAEKKPSDGDSFSEFLKHRKPLDKRLEAGNEESDANLKGNGETTGLNWSSSEDIALLNALKAFPKDFAMRWEKIAAAVPGKSKAACMKRVSELKKEFRSSKASNEG